MSLQYLEGKKFCVVFVKREDETNPNSPVKFKCLHGRASIDRRGGLTLESPTGSFQVPSSALNGIMESDGTEMLRDAEYFVMCHVSGMDI